MLVELVLATDMKQHFPINSQFSALHRLNKGSDESSPPVSEAMHSVKTPLDETERMLSLQVSVSFHRTFQKGV